MLLMIHCDYLTGGIDTFCRAATGIDEGCHDTNNYYYDWVAKGIDHLQKEITSVSLSDRNIDSDKGSFLPDERKLPSETIAFHRNAVSY